MRPRSPTRRALVALTAALLATFGLGACSSTSNSVTEPQPTLRASQDGSTTDTQVYNPFYFLGANYAANSTVNLAVYPNGTKAKPVFTQDVTIPNTGQLRVLINTIPAGDYEA